MSKTGEVVFHIDINAYYASAHRALNPELQGKPVVVAGSRRGSVVTTASYEARAYGVESAMPVEQALSLCPDLIVEKVDFDLYKRLSAQFFNIIRSFSPYVQVASIDECYVDVSEVIKKYEKPLDLAVDIQKTVYEKLLLPISIGVGPNKFLAKMASDMKKPMGITVLRIREVEEKLWPLPIEEMHGIGKKTVPRLKSIGVFTIGDLAKKKVSDVRLILGNRSQEFIDKANGYDQSPLELVRNAKSMGQSRTFKNALYDLEEIRAAIMTEIIEIEARMEEQKVLGRTVQFSIRFENFQTAVRSQTFDYYLEDRYEIFERVMDLYAEFEGEGGVTFLSVSLSNLTPRNEAIEQLNLFDEEEKEDIDLVIERLNSHLGSNVFKKTKDLIKNEK